MLLKPSTAASRCHDGEATVPYRPSHCAEAQTAQEARQAAERSGDRPGTGDSPAAERATQAAHRPCDRPGTEAEIEALFRSWSVHRNCSRPNAAHHARCSLPTRSAAIWNWPTGSTHKHQCCQDVRSARRHLPRRPDRQFQYLAQCGQARISWPTTVRLPVVNARCTDTDLTRHFGDRKTTPNSCFPKIATEGRFAGHRSSPFRIVDLATWCQGG